MIENTDEPRRIGEIIKGDIIGQPDPDRAEAVRQRDLASEQAGLTEEVRQAAELDQAGLLEDSEHLDHLKQAHLETIAESQQDTPTQ